MTVLYNEIDPFAAEWLENLIYVGAISDGIVDRRSIEDIHPNDLKGFTRVHFFAGIGVWDYALNRAGWRDDGRVTWTGSCPCQPFSAAGKGAGFADERHLWPAFYHLIRQCRPDVVLGEQVSSKDGLAWLDTVQTDMEATGYAFGAFDLCAAGVGAPHIRQRSFWVAHAGSAGHERRRAGETGHGRDAPRLEPERLCDVDGLADSNDAQRRTDAPGRDERDGSNAGWPQGSSDFERRFSPRVVGDPDGARSTVGVSEPAKRQERVAGKSNDPSREQSSALDGPAFGRLADANGRERGDGHIQPGGQYGQQQENGRSLQNRRPGPTNGFWESADWLACRDGKWRPVEPSHAKVVDGATRNMGQGGSNDRTETPQEEMTGAQMQVLPNAARTEKMVDGSAGGSDGFFQETVLRPGVHGGGLRRDDQNHEREEQPSPVGETSPPEMREVRAEGTPRPSSGRKSDEQRNIEFTDIVRLLPSAIARAKINGDERSFGYLSILREAILSEQPLPYTFKSVEEAWASLGEENKNGIRMAFDDPCLTIVRPFPLVVGASNRLGSLRGYGNAIVAPIAQEFIEGVMEYLA